MLHIPWSGAKGLLTVGENRTVEALAGTVEQKFSQGLVDIGLATIAPPTLPILITDAAPASACGVTPKAVVKAERPFPKEGGPWLCTEIRGKFFQVHNMLSDSVLLGHALSLKEKEKT